MIELRNAMFCWCSADRWPEWKALCEQCGDLPLNAARVFVVEHMGPDARSAAYLPSTWGACCDYWRKSSDAHRLSEMLLMFNRLVHEFGLRQDEVHTAFMAIEEYAALHAAGRLAIVSDREVVACVA